MPSDLEMYINRVYFKLQIYELSSVSLVLGQI